MIVRKALSLISLTMVGMALLVGFPAAGEVPAVEVGLKVPLAGFISMGVAEQLRLEASAVIPGFSAPLVDFEGRLVGKLYAERLEFSVNGLFFKPFIGGGVAVFQAVGEWVPGLVAVVGVESPAPGLGWPVTLLIEGSGTLLMSGAAPTLVFELSLGARYRFFMP